MMYTEEELKALGEVCLRRNILIVSDEIYEKLIYGGKNMYPSHSFLQNLKIKP